MSAPRLVGVLGGMGPLATLDFLQRLLDITGRSATGACAHRDLECAADSGPASALAGGGEDPLPAMLQGIARLNAAGATCIVIPCNTAHAWYAPLSAHSAAPILHIVDATVQALQTAAQPSPARIGVISTRGALSQRLYQARLEAAGLDYLTPTEQELDTLFTPGCYAIKANDIATGGRLLAQTAEPCCTRRHAAGHGLHRGAHRPAPRRAGTAGAERGPGHRTGPGLPAPLAAGLSQGRPQHTTVGATTDTTTAATAPTVRRQQRQPRSQCQWQPQRPSPPYHRHMRRT
jgi:aspartate racemase